MECEENECGEGGGGGLCARDGVRYMSSDARDGVRYMSSDTIHGKALSKLFLLFLRI